jgi:hypothetical protein
MPTINSVSIQTCSVKCTSVWVYFRFGAKSITAETRSTQRKKVARESKGVHSFTIKLRALCASAVHFLPRTWNTPSVSVQKCSKQPVDIVLAIIRISVATCTVQSTGKACTLAAVTPVFSRPPSYKCAPTQIIAEAGSTVAYRFPLRPLEPNRPG